VELVAAAPLVERPMLAAFDDRGRLYVADSAGVNLRGPELAKNPPHVIRMINFAGGFNLPIWMTQRQGFFAAERIDVKIDFTPGSTYQLTHMIAGTYDMGFTAIDNIIAYREGQNEAYLPPGTNVDLIAVLASDDGFLSISAQ